MSRRRSRSARSLPFLAVGFWLSLFTALSALPAAAQNQPTYNPISGGPPPQEDDVDPPAPPDETPDGPVLPPDDPEPPSGGDPAEPPGGPEVDTPEAEVDGTLGDDKFGSVYNVNASTWTKPLEGMKYGGKQKARFDVIILNKRYNKVLSHQTKIVKFKQGKPQTSFEVELLDNGISFVGAYSKSYTILSVTAQFFIGPVPIVLTAGAAACMAGGLNGMAELIGGSSLSVSAFGTAGVGVTIAAGVGFKWGCIGVEGLLHILKGILDLTLARQDGWSLKAVLSVATSGEVNLFAKVAFVKKKYPIWKSPVKTWFEKVLLDKQF